SRIGESMRNLTQAERELDEKIDDIEERFGAEGLKAAAKLLARGEGDRSNLPVIGTYGTGARVAPALQLQWQRAYRPLPADEQELRSPEKDHWNAAWLQALVQGDHSRRREVEDRMAVVNGYSRADTLEGTANASGGFAGGTGAVLLPRPLE